MEIKDRTFIMENNVLRVQYNSSLESVVEHPIVFIDRNYISRWITALRSGGYKQGHRKLYTPENDTYCCLGILNVVCSFYESDDQAVLNYSTFSKVINDSEDNLQGTFYRMNDLWEFSFDEIANVLQFILDNYNKSE